jgi:hypothetical protein
VVVMPYASWDEVNAGIWAVVNAANWSDVNAAMSSVAKVLIRSVLSVVICAVVKPFAKPIVFLLEVLPVFGTESPVASLIWRRAVL